MPTLQWIGKDAVVDHDKLVPFRLLKKVKGASVGEGSQNLIIHGDNLEALKALMPYYAGKIKCIYIDPPYNTGNEGWVYNDRVNSPKIKAWLGKTVGKELEDLSRHDKWLCMMYPRLKLLRDLLADDGAIFVSIDDNEHCYLKLLLDEIFGEENFVANIIWQKVFAKKNKAQYFSVSHDYVIVFAKQKNQWKRNLVSRSDKDLSVFKNPDNDPRGPWQSVSFSVQSEDAERRKAYRYGITIPSGQVVFPPTGRHWNGLFNRFEELDADKRLWYGKKGDSAPREKIFLSEVQDGIVPDTWWSHETAGNNQEAKKEIVELFGTEEPFISPKPIRLLKKILQLSTNKDDLILDSFAGSGTTGHAVLDLNKEDGGNRKFVLVEMESDIAKDITAERVKRAIKKYEYDDGFEYCELGKPLFDEKGNIEETTDFRQFATYIYFTETQTNIDPKKISDPFIGDKDEVEYYLVYKEAHKNILNKTVLKKIEETPTKKIIYADICELTTDELEAYNIQFKQIPYEVKVY